MKLAAWALFSTLIGTVSIASAQQIVIKDHAGQTVTLERPAARLASIPMPISSTIIAMDGSTSKLIGMNPTAKAAILEGILGEIFPEAKDINADVTAPNFIPNIEEMAAVNPDLVIQWADYGSDYIDPLTNAGLNVLQISYGTETKTREYQTMIATAIGKPERAEENSVWRNKVEADIRSKVEAIPADKRPKVLYLGRAMDKLTASGAKGNYNTWYIELTGGTSASADVQGQGATISPEQIAEWDPDVILLNAFEPALGLDRILNDPILSLTKAAKAGKVYKLPLGGYRWDPPNQESPLTWMWLANLLHPDVFSYDLRSEMKSAYKTLYNYDLSEAQIDAILRMDMQGKQPNYGVFAAK